MDRQSLEFAIQPIALGLEGQALRVCLTIIRSKDISDIDIGSRSVIPLVEVLSNNIQVHDLVGNVILVHVDAFHQPNSLYRISSS
jgi:hypothetical protein